jgi:hypothetical protein
MGRPSSGWVQVLCFLVLPWLGPFLLFATEDFGGFVFGAAFATMLAAALARRAGYSIEVVALFAFLTAVLSIVALVIAFRFWAEREFGDL